METIKTINTAANNAEYQPNSTNKYVEKYQKQTLEILQNPNTTFSEFINEQSIATDLSRLWWIKKWAMLKEQLSYLNLYNEGQQKQEKLQVVNNRLTWAPDLEPKILWWLAA